MGSPRGRGLECPSITQITCRFILHISISSDLLWRGLPDEHGMDATPGHQNNFVVQESRFSRLKKPYPSNCYSNWTQTSYSKYVEDLSYNYSRTVRLTIKNRFYIIIIQWLQLCNRFCLLDLIYEHCKCFHPSYLNEKAIGDRDGDICNLTFSGTHNLCYMRVLFALETDKLKCNCSNACTDIVYNVAVSSSKWPSLLYMECIYRILYNGGVIIIKYLFRIKLKRPMWRDLQMEPVDHRQTLRMLLMMWQATIFSNSTSTLGPNQWQQLRK